jgi:CRP-like cAMP-binding protein/di/tricarboxylate transporter
VTIQHPDDIASGEDEARRDLLWRVDLVAGLDRVALARLVAHIEPQPILAGAVVCEEGDPSEALYIVVRGRFGVFVRADGGIERRISSLGPGDYFGEIGLLVPGTRSATVRVETDGELLRLDREAFLRLLDEDPRAGRAVATALARRLRQRDRPDSAHATAAPTAAALSSGRSAPSPGRRRVVKAVGVVAAVILVAAAFFLFDLAQWRFSLFVLAAVVLWVTEPVPNYVVSLALVASWLISGIAPAYATIYGFASLNWIFVVAVLGIASAVARSGLLLRLGLLLIERVPSGLRWQSAALLGTGILLTPLLPLAMARAAITAPLGVAVADALRLRDREPATALLGLSAWVGSGPFLFLFMNGSPVCLILWSLMPKGQEQFNWLFWLMSAAPLGVMIAAGMFVALHLLNRPGPDAPQRRERLRLQHAVLGPPSRVELAVAVIVGLTLVGWIVGPMFLIHPGLVALLAFIAVSVVTRASASDLARLDWGYLIFYGVALSLSNLVEGLRLNKIVAEPAGARLAELGISGPVFVLFVALLTVLVRSVLPADQAVVLLGLALIPIAGAVGVHPWLVVIAILTLALSWHVVAQTPEYLVAHVASEGRLYSHAQARRAAFAYLVVAFTALALSLPYWHLLGLV